MRARELSLALVEAPGATLGQRIALTLQKAILEGRLPPGTALPGSRVLAEQLDVSRRTIILALEELEAQGWLVTQPNCGTFVATELPSGEKGRPVTLPTTRVGFDLPSLLRPMSTALDGSLLLEDGAADPRLAPAEELARGYQRALRRDGARLLEDRDPLGTPLLRETVAAWISERHGVRVTADRVLITRGSRGALAMVAASLFKPGSLAAVENPGHRGAWEILQQAAKLHLRPVPVDADGLIPAALEELLKRERIHLLYLTPRRQFPTTATLAPERKAEILRLAAEYRVAVLEDDYDGEIHYGEVRPEPLLAVDQTGQVLHIGSLSRLLAPGLKLGYLVIPQPLVPFLARIKRTLGEQGDPVLEWAVADLIRDGNLARHLRKMRKVYAARRDFLVGRLRSGLGDALEVQAPLGGMSLWLRGREGVEVEAWIQAVRTKGLVLNPPSRFYLGEPGQGFRMGFAQVDETELEAAVRRLEAARAGAARPR
ncbi:aminotransferase-like domain-containing protein [Mesoterricola silvestris]|uniref:GntR family transcriptional regulator n=1 Tax=Mesoterricola silvestris TaxID=2927979 RepID=A0AA48KBB0_9BACT|nr:PLP-dependent aminotransferase family protein [Mesoterricola silvestris]BDU74152.1 GntR family transcriptional regulator [Mesoterricola silvestris]